MQKLLVSAICNINRVNLTGYYLNLRSAPASRPNISVNLALIFVICLF